MRNLTLRLRAHSTPAVVWLIVQSFSNPFGVAPTRLDHDDLLEHARARYYNLRRAGLIEFQANIEPNWNVVLAGASTNSNARKVFNTLHFSMAIDEASRLRLDHQADATLRDPKLAQQVEQIFKQTESALSSFISTWSVFMLTSPFPQPESDYRLTQSDGRYQFIQNEPASQVVVTADENLAIVEIRASGAGFSGVTRPTLEKTAKGFVLTGYTSTYQSESPARNITVNAILDYEEQRGLHLLHKVKLDTVYNGEPAQVEWLFTDYRVKVKS